MNGSSPFIGRRTRRSGAGQRQLRRESIQINPSARFLLALRRTSARSVAEPTDRRSSGLSGGASEIRAARRPESARCLVSVYELRTTAAAAARAEKTAPRASQLLITGLDDTSGRRRNRPPLIYPPDCISRFPSSSSSSSSWMFGSAAVYEPTILSQTNRSYIQFSLVSHIRTRQRNTHSGPIKRQREPASSTR